ncbi:MAG TPA: 5-formyltetrahydrofolate cyclo-ligase [Eubacterium sp.]|nr:5-formyltetrahydrofolate cyclo-ligase [Eubacterium sp.]HAZ87089.1 5-formyltetrahydrofolate cyclo-ligase [Eubacterium sp.]
MADEIFGKRDEKNLIRKQMKQLRADMTRTERFEKSMQIFEQLITVPEFKRADRIYTYVSMDNEIDTIMFIDYSLSLEKRVFVPRVSGKDMEFYEISDISELSPGYRGIYEPDINGREPDYSRTGFMCMPGLAFDRSYNRIGYGGGFYDRYLSVENKLYKAALAYEAQLLESIPAQDGDVRPDMIVTEENIYRKLDY